MIKLQKKIHGNIPLVFIPDKDLKQSKISSKSNIKNRKSNSVKEILYYHPSPSLLTFKIHNPSKKKSN
jgi:hypothetical protein